MDDEWAGLVLICLFVCLLSRKVDGEREKTHVFDQEHRLPTNLRTQVLHRQFASVTDASGRQDGVVVERLGFALERELLPFDVELQKRVP